MLNIKIYSDTTNADLPIFFLFRHVKQGAFNHTEFKKNFQNSEPSDTKSKATERPPERKNKLVNSSRAKYKFVHLMKLICKFIVNTQNAIRSCLLALIFDPTTLIEIAVYSGTPPYGHLVNTATSLLRPLFFVPTKWPYIFLQ